MSAPLDRPLYGASWGSANVRFFANYAIFRGRASPSEYWWWALTNVLVLNALNLLGVLWCADDWAWGPVGLPLMGGSTGPIAGAAGVLALIFSLGTLLPNFAITWRRLHDTGRSGLWFFIAFLPIVGWIVLLIFLVGGPREEGRQFD